MPWTGEWPGEDQCREFGWFTRRGPGGEWVRCEQGDPGAEPDLNRLLTEAEWAPTQRRFVKREFLLGTVLQAANEEMPASRDTRHPQVPIAWRGRYAEVDAEMAPLILLLWMAGIDTINSCQENFPGIAWVEFRTTRDAKRFLDLVAAYPDQGDIHTVNDRTYVGDTPFWETLYGRITGHGAEGPVPAPLKHPQQDRRGLVAEGGRGRQAGVDQLADLVERAPRGDGHPRRLHVQQGEAGG
jgi:hypothetical protein